MSPFWTWAQTLVRCPQSALELSPSQGEEKGEAFLGVAAVVAVAVASEMSEARESSAKRVPRFERLGGSERSTLEHQEKGEAGEPQKEVTMKPEETEAKREAAWTLAGIQGAG